MDNDKEKQDKARQNGQQDMPIKTPTTDSIKRTAAEEEGLNKQKTDRPSLEPGTSSDPDFTETD